MFPVLLYLSVRGFRFLIRQKISGLQKFPLCNSRSVSLFNASNYYLLFQNISAKIILSFISSSFNTILSLLKNNSATESCICTLPHQFRLTVAHTHTLLNGRTVTLHASFSNRRPSPKPPIHNSKSRKTFRFSVFLYDFSFVFSFLISNQFFILCFVFLPFCIFFYFYPAWPPHRNPDRILYHLAKSSKIRFRKITI